MSSKKLVLATNGGSSDVFFIWYDQRTPRPSASASAALRAAFLQKKPRVSIRSSKKLGLVKN